MGLKLVEKTGIFCSISIGKKEHPNKRVVSIQAYVTEGTEVLYRACQDTKIR